MKNSLPRFIGTRYIFSKRREGFVSFLSLFSLLAMALGVAALIIVLSVMNGFGQEIRGRILQVASHITLQHPTGLSPEHFQQLQHQLAEQPLIKEVRPLVKSYAMVSSSYGQVGAVLQGVNPQQSDSLNREAVIKFGHWEALTPKSYGVVMGLQLARQLGVVVGDKVQLSLPMVSVTPAGLFPRSKVMTVVGLFEAGAQIDGMLVFIHQQDAQKLLRLGSDFSGVELVLTDPNQAEMVRAELVENTDANWEWHSWITDMGGLFQAMQMEKIIVGLLLSIIIAVAAFNIVASLVLMVADKRGDIAVLRTMGLSSTDVTRIFRIQGLAVGGIGIVIGVLFGSVVAYFIGDIVQALEALFGFYVFDPNLYFVTELPSDLQPWDVITVVVASIVMAFFATLYPAYRAGQIQPAEALRYDH